MKYSIIFFFLLLGYSASFGQAATYSDPAQAYIRILLEKSGEGGYKQIGNFKVLGTSYLYGGNQFGDVFFKNGSAPEITAKSNPNK